jgi:hypothetical protein
MINPVLGFGRVSFVAVESLSFNGTVEVVKTRLFTDGCHSTHTGAISCVVRKKVDA